ncbi:hypothetical protein HDU76_009184, partial [Blyttiomyces sp. JEL0837]
MPPVWVTPLICAIAVLGVTIQIYRSRKQSIESRDLVNRNSPLTEVESGNQVQQPTFEPWDKTGRWALVAQIASCILLGYGSYLISSGIYTEIKTTDYQGTISGGAQILGGIATVLLWRSLLLPVRAVVGDNEVIDVVADLKKRSKQQIQSALSHGASAVKDSKDVVENVSGIAGNSVDALTNPNEPGTKPQHAAAAEIGVGIGIASISGVLGVAITIASVAITTIATSIPGVMSPLGGLPPTTANLATHFRVDSTTNKTTTTTNNNNNGAPPGSCLCTQTCVDAWLAMLDYVNSPVVNRTNASQLKCVAVLEQTDYWQQCNVKFQSKMGQSVPFFEDKGVLNMASPYCTDLGFGGCLASYWATTSQCYVYPKAQEFANSCCGLIL